MSSNAAQIRSWLLEQHANTVCADRLKATADLVWGLDRQGVRGSFVEVGCFKGAMSLWLRVLLDELPWSDRDIHVYDSFQGLPPPGDQDSAHLAGGELVASPADVLAIHARWGRDAPEVHAGWFRDILPTQLPPSIAFAYLDGDFYDSILTSLQYCVPRMVPGGVLVIDDYADTSINPRAWDGLPGVKRACDDYFARADSVEVIIGDGDLAYGVYRAPR